MVRAADDMRDAELEVVDDRGELVRRAAVRSREGRAAAREVDRALVVADGRARLQSSRGRLRSTSSLARSAGPGPRRSRPRATRGRRGWHARHPRPCANDPYRRSGARAPRAARRRSCGWRRRSAHCRDGASRSGSAQSAPEPCAYTQPRSRYSSKPRSRAAPTWPRSSSSSCLTWKQDLPLSNRSSSGAKRSLLLGVRVHRHEVEADVAFLADDSCEVHLRTLPALDLDVLLRPELEVALARDPAGARGEGRRVGPESLLEPIENRGEVARRGHPSIVTCPGCKATRPSQARIARYGPRSNSPSCATCVYA